MKELRCSHGHLFGRIDTERRIIEVRARSGRCALSGEVAPPHYFSLDTGQEVHLDADGRVIPLRKAHNKRAAA